MSETPRPLIGITTSYHIADSAGYDYISSRMVYVRAVAESGGAPVLLPPLGTDEQAAACIAHLDGLVLSGGFDVPPSAYRQPRHPKTAPMETIRWESESRLARFWLEAKPAKPLLAICLGLQVVNVIRGGTLIQDIPSQWDAPLTHRADGKTDAFHTVVIIKPSLVYDIFATHSLAVASSHHQAIDQPGCGLKVTASSADGVTEAMEIEDHPFGLLVQWHPERMVTDHYAAIFSAMIKACKV